MCLQKMRKTPSKYKLPVYFSKLNCPFTLCCPNSYLYFVPINTIYPSINTQKKLDLKVLDHGKVYQKLLLL